MVSYRFCRLVRKPQSGAGRRYYRLLSYPHDCGEFATLEEAETYARARKFSALFIPSQHSWITFNDSARQCVAWHEAGKDDYVNII